MLTLDSGAQPILWCGRRSLGPADLDLRPDLRPVVIRDGALGNRGDVMVSPQHAVLVETADGQVLVRARHLAEMGDKRFRVARGKKSVIYHHILLPKHAIIFANGMATETMYPGPMAAMAIGPVACAEIGVLMPELAPCLIAQEGAAKVYGPTVRPVARRQELVARRRQAVAAG